MNKKKNYLLESIKYIQCIVDKVMIKTALAYKMDIVESKINELKIKDSECPNARITKSDLKGSILKEVNLTDVQINNCQIEGLRINGHLISELIEERESTVKRK